MMRPIATAVALLLCSAALHADVAVTTVTTVQGGAIAAAANASPTLTTRVKGQKARLDLEAMGRTIITLADIAAKQVMLLRPDEKTAEIVSATALPAAPAASSPGEATFKPTGQTRAIDGVTCDEYTFSMNMNMSDLTGPQIPAHAAEMMKGMQVAISGSVWTSKSAPGAAEYLAFYKAAGDAGMTSAMTASLSGLAPGFDKIIRALTGGEGIPYLTEMTITVDGSGQVADMLRQMGPTTVTSKVSKVSTEPIADDVFSVPADYKVVKQF
jgi:hypothetical protein